MNRDQGLSHEFRDAFHASSTRMMITSMEDTMKTNMQNLKIEHPPSRQTTSECYILRTIATTTNWARGQRTLHINITNSATFSSPHPRELSISRDKLPNHCPYHSYPLYTLETHRETGSIDNRRISDLSSNRQHHNNFSDGTILQRCHLGMFYVNHTSTVSTKYEDVVGLFLVVLPADMDD